MNLVEVVKACSYFPRLVLDEDNVELFEEVSLEELSGGLVAFQKGKSLGPDGWMVEFFTTFFEILGKDLLRVVKEVRSFRWVIPNFNSTFIVLISKVDNPTDFGDFMSISLRNCVYKINAKILAVRIKKLLSKVISLEQFKFVEGR